jgi:hypothetical protein
VVDGAHGVFARRLVAGLAVGVRGRGGGLGLDVGALAVLKSILAISFMAFLILKFKDCCP